MDEGSSFLRENKIPSCCGFSYLESNHAENENDHLMQLSEAASIKSCVKPAISVQFQDNPHSLVGYHCYTEGPISLINIHWTHWYFQGHDLGVVNK